MSTQIQDFLSREWVEEELRGYAVPVVRALSDEFHAQAISLDATHRPTDEKWAWATKDCQRRCELEYAFGTHASRIREMCKDFCTLVVQQIPHWDFGLADPDREDGTPLRQPMWNAMPNIWLLAAVSGDRAITHELTKSYRTWPVVRLDSQARIRETILRHALAEDTALELQLAEKLMAGYPSDFPPDLIEFPLGVIRRDTKLLIKAVKKQSNTFKRKWSIEAIQKWHQKKFAEHPKGFRSPGPWDSFIRSVRRDLISFHWVFSWWAVAWLNIARWRGMSEVFEDPKIFSEWVPLDLCIN